MTDHIQITGRDIAFPCEPGQTILDAAEQAGFALPYSCRKGVCSSCKGGLVSGELVVGRGSTLSGRHEDILYCTARPRGPIEIAPKWIEARTAPQRRRFTARVYRIDHPAPDVAIVHLRLPIGRRMPFRAGQYAKLFMANGDSRNYSLANPPHDNDVAVLHVRRVPGGRFSDRTLATLAQGSSIDIELPYGLFTMSGERETPAVMLATGTGYSSVRSMIADLIRRRERRPVHLFWGGRTFDDLYAAAELDRWAERHAWFTFTPVLSRPSGDWTGATGHVQLAALHCYPDLRGHEIYACGNPAMIDDARTRMTRSAGLAEDNFYADPFVPAGDPVLPP